MRIKKIELIGFKSFADREVIHVDDHITAILGPNGCGKSNIVDAMRWCLGEQRAKHLRGQGMQDVIFSGSSTRGPGGLAEVTVTFENQGDAPVAYLDYAEIAVTRRLYRDGTSEYLVNKLPCRLRDVQELMMGTGAGTRGYSIIEQGQVGTLVSSKPEDRRMILDEAAGITRFKSQKQAAERKIEQTQQNLVRVTDVLGELTERLGSLRKQAQKAERYNRLTAEVKDLELWIASHQFLALQGRIFVLSEQRRQVSEKANDIDAQRSICEARLQAKRLEVHEREQTLIACQQQVFDLENRLQLTKAENQYRLREQEGLGQALIQTRTEIRRSQETLAGFQQELEVVLAEYTQLTQGEGQEKVLVHQYQQEYAELQANVQAKQSNFEQLRHEQQQRISRKSHLDARVEAAKQSLADLQSSVQEGEQAANEQKTALTTLSQELVQAKQQYETALSELESLSQERTRLKQTLQVQKEQLALAQRHVQQQKTEVERIRSRALSLEEVSARYRDCRGGVALLMDHKSKLMPEFSDSSAPEMDILAKYMDVPAHLEAAVSAAAGDGLQGVLVTHEEQIIRGVDLLKTHQEGRIAFLPRDCRPSPQKALEELPEGEDSQVVGLLLDLIGLPEELKPLGQAVFANTMVVQDLASGLRYWREHEQISVVTLTGERIDASGIVVGGASDAANTGLLQQKREIHQLQMDLQAAMQSLSELEQALQQQTELGEQTEQEWENKEQELRIAEDHKRSLAQEIRHLEQLEQQARRRIDEFTKQHEARAQQLSHHQTNLEQWTNECTKLAERLPELASQVEVLQGELQALNQARDELATQLTQAKVALARWQQQRDSCVAHRKRLEKQQASEEERCRHLQAKETSDEARLEELKQAFERTRGEIETIFEAHKQASEANHDAREAHEAARRVEEELEVEARQLRKQLDHERSLLQEHELALKEQELELSHLEQDVHSRHDCVLREVLIEHHCRAPVGTEQRDQLRDLKQSLRRMGEVNLMAIQEYTEVSQRHDYLDQQKTDLEAAIAQLTEAIEKINQTSRERFQTTFEQVNEMFQNVFPRLFSGGKAELRLTQPDDLLNTGVEIIAQPPGKQVRNLELLSGGEKALTATSLVFAIFLIKPSPFCLLDEVDAPLDEANVGRFGQMVKEMAERTQFIIITHNKRTMEIADRLYGVTMEQRGVSKLVSVNMRRAAEMVEYA